MKSREYVWVVELLMNEGQWCPSDVCVSRRAAREIAREKQLGRVRKAVFVAAVPGRGARAAREGRRGGV